MKWINYLKTKWGIKSNIQFFVIMLVFSITGSLALLIAKPILQFTGMTPNNTRIWLYILVRIAILFPIYQLLILIVGWFFGQFSFFWSFEKKILRRLGFHNVFKQ
ncbi:MAG: DUF6787 family protein [Bacteroidota bacterium]|nr:DUF6787 family protein [Bacteroidota bacterium]